MSGISSVGSSASAASYSPLDKNDDGVVDARELQEAAQPSLLPASILTDEDSDGTVSSGKTELNALEIFIREMEASMNVCQNTCGQYDTDAPDSVAA
ncbi:hypothetical protein [Rhizobium leucaenae]|jgi:hypothetical protein|uniref:EF-hand domain-containing protein n=1 Tax=Rhizobium leucaenae TaxID=29450 RepID=A0A7W6ZXA8_9HYPH|nr:hypothetical protein [Rhizobium leucaenae]MBB4570260.1 hypothetical protein [Rhizobium leucaenae]MBB6302911.1 hypothetical protein [Rhizobium leucaenae]